MEFTWDEQKNRANRQKHGISFENAMLVFDDPYHLTSQDREVDGEPRWSNDRNGERNSDDTRRSHRR
jgi:uncharacterized DUF497 family protein